MLKIKRNIVNILQEDGGKLFDYYFGQLDDIKHYHQYDIDYLANRYCEINNKFNKTLLTISNSINCDFNPIINSIYTSIKANGFDIEQIISNIDNIIWSKTLNPSIYLLYYCWIYSKTKNKDLIFKIRKYTDILLKEQSKLDKYRADEDARGLSGNQSIKIFILNSILAYLSNYEHKADDKESERPKSDNEFFNKITKYVFECGYIEKARELETKHSNKKIKTGQYKVFCDDYGNIEYLAYEFTKVFYDDCGNNYYSADEFKKYKKTPYYYRHDDTKTIKTQYTLYYHNRNDEKLIKTKYRRITRVFNNTDEMFKLVFGKRFKEIGRQYERLSDDNNQIPTSIFRNLRDTIKKEHIQSALAIFQYNMLQDLKNAHYSLIMCNRILQGYKQQILNKK